MLLWEVDHRQAFPSLGGEGLTGALVGFTKRLERASRDAKLDWLSWREVSAPLSAGLAPSHHRRWSVRVVAPEVGQPRGWYEEFVGRWQAYLEVMARPRGSRPMSSVSPVQLARVRPGLLGGGSEEASSSSTLVSGRGSPPGKRRRGMPPSAAGGEQGQTGPRGSTRAGSPSGLPPAKRRQGTLAGWVRVGSTRAASSSDEGRGAAVTGCGRAEPSTPT